MKSKLNNQRAIINNLARIQHLLGSILSPWYFSNILKTNSLSLGGGSIWISQWPLLIHSACWFRAIPEAEPIHLDLTLLHGSLLRKISTNHTSLILACVGTVFKRADEVYSLLVTYILSTKGMISFMGHMPWVERLGEGIHRDPLHWVTLQPRYYKALYRPLLTCL